MSTPKLISPSHENILVDGIATMGTIVIKTLHKSNIILYVTFLMSHRPTSQEHVDFESYGNPAYHSEVSTSTSWNLYYIRGHR